MGWINKIVMPECELRHTAPPSRSFRVGADGVGRESVERVAPGSEWQCDGCGRIMRARREAGVVNYIGPTRLEWVPESPREYQARWLKAERDYHARGREQYTYSFGGR